MNTTTINLNNVQGRATPPRTAAQWIADNPILPVNYLGFETDTGKYKLGDGVTAWNSLSYPAFGGGGVPYTGATQSLDMGEFGVDAGFYQFDLTPTNTPTAQGTAYWDDNAETVALIMNGVTQKIGEDTFFHVKNSTGSNIAAGVAVRFAGTDGNSGKLLIAPFLADGTYPSQYFMGVTSEAIDNGEEGKVYQFGKMKQINTSAYQDSDILYASSTVAGGYQTTPPAAPNNVISVAAVINAANNGVLMIRPIIEDVKFANLRGNISDNTALQTALDGKVDENPAISGATKTKITYDAKGLVTAGADLAASDMPSGIDAVKIANGNVSNTEFQYLDGVTSAIQTQLDSKLGAALSINTQTASYTLVLADANKLVRMNVASANDLTIPPNSSVAFGIGTVIYVEQMGAGTTTIVAGSGVTINPTAKKTPYQYGVVTLVQVAADVWNVIGATV